MTHTSASGSTISRMGLGSMYGVQETSTKANGKCAFDTVKAATNLQLAIAMLESITSAELKDMASTLGVTGTPTQVNSLTAKKMDKAIGARARTTSATNTQANTERTRNTAMVNSVGLLALNIREITSKTRNKGMVRCIGLMVVFLEDSGIKVRKMD